MKVSGRNVGRPGRKDIEYRKEIISEDCSKCNGDGRVRASDVKCPDCEKGITQGLFGETVCKRCSGNVWIKVYERCDKCGGSGTDRFVREIARCRTCGKLQENCNCHDPDEGQYDEFR